MRRLFDNLLAETRAIHESTPALRDFAAWPSDLVYRAPEPRLVPVVTRIRAMAGDGAFQTALAAVADHACWQQTYSEAEVGRHFLDNYGYVEIFGPTGVFLSSQCRGFIGYWEQGLQYPMHDHEAEEIYLVLGGSGIFEVPGQASRLLRPGDTQTHLAFQPHATTMRDEGLLALCLWRGPGLEDRAHITPDT